MGHVLYTNRWLSLIKKNKMRFPFSEREYDELRLISEESLPIKEDSIHFFSEHYSEIRTYSIDGNTEEEYLSQELKYDQKGIIESRKNWEKNGKLWREENCKIDSNKLLIQSNLDNTIWLFNDKGNLVELIYASEKDYEERIFFKYDENQYLIEMNENIKIERKEGIPFLVKDTKNDLIITQYLERTDNVSKIIYPNTANRNSSQVPRVLKYNNHNQLISDEHGAWLKEINYFGYDMMSGKRITQYLNGKESWEYYEEEKLIEKGIVEVKSEYQEKNGITKRKYREIKKMKTTANNA